jgi:hypothetical protein
MKNQMNINGERGAAALLATGFFAAGGFLVLLIITLIGGTALQGTGKDNAAGGVPSKDAWDTASDGTAIENPTDSPSQTGSISTRGWGDMDVGTRRLVCAFLPGISPMPNMLDERVARRWLLVKQELDSRGVGVKINYAFRTLCQQINVKSGKNSYANPCSGSISPHMCGRAVDINGMGNRAYASRVVPVFRKYGWEWLGADDPPHFQVNLELVGESKATLSLWSKAMQGQFYDTYNSRRGSLISCMPRHDCLVGLANPQPGTRRNCN